jgi:hypothetical protein
MIARLQFAIVLRSVIRLHRRFPTDAEPSSQAVARFEARHARMVDLRECYHALAR